MQQLLKLYSIIETIKKVSSKILVLITSKQDFKFLKRLISLCVSSLKYTKQTKKPHKFCEVSGKS